jgi:hypothetical protein
VHDTDPDNQEESVVAGQVENEMALSIQRGHLERNRCSMRIKRDSGSWQAIGWGNFFVAPAI